MLKILGGGQWHPCWKVHEGDSHIHVKTVQGWLELSHAEPKSLDLFSHPLPTSAPYLMYLWLAHKTCRDIVTQQVTCFCQAPNQECHQIAPDTCSRGPVLCCHLPTYVPAVTTFIYTLAKFGRSLISSPPCLRPPYTLWKTMRPRLASVSAVRQAKQPFPGEQNPDSLHSGLSYTKDFIHIWDEEK